MANPERGEADLTVGGKVYTLKWGYGAQVELYELLDRPPAEVGEMLQQGRPDIIRAFVWAMLRKHHRGLSLDDINEILDQAPLDDVATAIGLAIQRAQPAGGKAEENPREASR